MAIGFCTQCSFEVESFDGLTCCPRCGSKGKPCANEDQRTVSVNLHELRLLCIWAENWEGTFKEADKTDVVYAIAARLRKQIENCPPLTMADEFKQLKDAGYDFVTNHRAADNPDTGKSYTETP